MAWRVPGRRFLDKPRGQPINGRSLLPGAVAQMGERCNRTAEVRGSIPLGSTNEITYLAPRRKIKKPTVTHPSHTDAWWHDVTPCDSCGYTRRCSLRFSRQFPPAILRGNDRYTHGRRHEFPWLRSPDFLRLLGRGPTAGREPPHHLLSSLLPIIATISYTLSTAQAGMPMTVKGEGRAKCSPFACPALARWPAPHSPAAVHVRSLGRQPPCASNIPQALLVSPAERAHALLDEPEPRDDAGVGMHHIGDEWPVRPPKRSFVRTFNWIRASGCGSTSLRLIIGWK